MKLLSVLGLITMTLGGVRIPDDVLAVISEFRIPSRTWAFCLLVARIRNLRAGGVVE